MKVSVTICLILFLALLSNCRNTKQNRPPDNDSKTDQPDPRDRRPIEPSEEDGSNEDGTGFTSTVWQLSAQASNDNGQKRGRTFIRKRFIGGDSSQEYSREEVLGPDGRRTVTDRSNVDGKTKVKRYSIDESGKKKQIPSGKIDDATDGDSGEDKAPTSKSKSNPQ